MSRTFLGQLILRLQDQMSGKAKRAATDVTGSMKMIEDRARRLAGVQWGVGFQRQMEKMGASAKEFDQVRRSWDRLQQDLRSRNLGTALQKSEVGAWKVATLSHLAEVRSSMRSTEKEARRIGLAMKLALKPAYIAMGGYSGAYMVGHGASMALAAASEDRRVQAEAKYSGLSGGERGKIDTRANDLSEKYRLNKSQIYEVMKEASLSMPSTDSALAVSDDMAKAFLVLSNALGSTEQAIAGLRSFNKAMDNIEQVSPDEYRFGLENYMKAQQVIGKDIDPDAFAQAIKYSRSAGKVVSPEFLFKWLPMLIAETGGSDAGTKLRAGFDQFVVGRASKKSLLAQKEYGIRSEDGKLLGEEAFGENPIKWIYDVLLPQLEKKGFNKDNEVELARVVGELTNNRLSSDLIMSGILSFAQYRRLVEERLPNATGLDAANQVQADNPFAAFQGFKDSISNLSSAIMPMTTISQGLNSFADGLNAFTAKVREGDPSIATGLAVGGIAAAGFGTYKIGSAIYGLITAGTNLNAAALALQQAAAMQGGGGAGELLEGKNSGKAGWFALMLKAKNLSLAAAPGLAAGALTYSPGSFEEQVAQQQKNKEQMQRMAGFFSSKHFWLGKGADPDVNVKDAFGIKLGRPDTGASPEAMDEILSSSADVGRQMAENLSVTAKPNVDGSGIKSALADAKELKAVLGSLGSLVATAQQKVDVQMRRSFADYGVSP